MLLWLLWLAFKIISYEVLRLWMKAGIELCSGYLTIPLKIKIKSWTNEKLKLPIPEISLKLQKATKNLSKIICLCALISTCVREFVQFCCFPYFYFIFNLINHFFFLQLFICSPFESLSCSSVVVGPWKRRCSFRSLLFCYSYFASMTGQCLSRTLFVMCVLGSFSKSKVLC